MKTTERAWERGARAAPERNTLYRWQSNALGTGSLLSLQEPFASQGSFTLPSRLQQQGDLCAARHDARCPLEDNLSSRSFAQRQQRHLQPPQSSGTWWPASKGHGAAQRACVAATRSSGQHGPHQLWSAPACPAAAFVPPHQHSASWPAWGQWQDGALVYPTQGQQRCINWACRGFSSRISLPLSIH